MIRSRARHRARRSRHARPQDRQHPAPPAFSPQARGRRRAPAPKIAPRPAAGSSGSHTTRARSLRTAARPSPESARTAARACGSSQPSARSPRPAHSA